MADLSREQEAIVQALAERYGSAKTLPLQTPGIVGATIIACGWRPTNDGFDMATGEPRSGKGEQAGPWWWIANDPASPEGLTPNGYRLRHATDEEIRRAHEASDARELLAEAGLTDG